MVKEEIEVGGRDIASEYVVQPIKNTKRRQMLFEARDCRQSIVTILCQNSVTLTALSLGNSSWNRGVQKASTGQTVPYSAPKHMCSDSNSQQPFRVRDSPRHSTRAARTPHAQNSQF